jgi:hypothetical protein
VVDNIHFDITKVEDFSNVCLTTQKEKCKFFSPPLIKCENKYICLSNKTYLIILILGNVLGIDSITESNYIEVYKRIEHLISVNGNYGVSVEEKDLKEHIGLRIFKALKV